MIKPTVICHMMCTIDGRIIVENWGKGAQKFTGVYEQCHDTFESQAWMVGRVTMEKDFTEGEKPVLKKISNPVSRLPFIGNKHASSFAIAVDPKGKLGWTNDEIDGDHIIEILTESASDEYLDYLMGLGISFIVAGKENVDFKSALQQLAEVFSIRTLMLEGGGHVNGSVLNEGLVDEISVLIAPIVDGTQRAPTTFEISDYLPKKSATTLALKGMEKLENDVIWLKYSVKTNVD